MHQGSDPKVNTIQMPKKGTTGTTRGIHIPPENFENQVPQICYKCIILPYNILLHHSIKVMHYKIYYKIDALTV